MLMMARVGISFEIASDRSLLLYEGNSAKKRTVYYLSLYCGWCSVRERVGARGNE